MLKNVKKVLAVIVAVSICVCLCACHKPGETAVTVDGVNFSSGVYSCILLAADDEGMQKASEAAEETEVSKNNKDYLKMQIEDKDFTVWVKDRALEICKQFAAAKKLCEDNGVETANYIDNAKANAEMYWNYGATYFGFDYATYYTSNGVSLDSFKEYMAYNAYKTAYFESIYGENGKTPISAEEIEEQLHKNYGYVDVLTTQVSGLDTESIDQIQETLKEYATRIYEGESFASVYAESQGSEYTPDESDFGTFSNTYAQIWGAEGTSYETDQFKCLDDVAEGEVAVVPYVNSYGDEYRVLVLRADIMNEKNSNLATLKNAARTDLKGDEITKAIDDCAEKLELKEVKSSTNQFKVNKISFLEDR